MAEVAPGLIVNDWMPHGFAYAINMSDLPGFEDFGDRGRAVVLSQHDWELIPPAEREALADEITRHSADAGLERLQRFLATQQPKENQ